jgi:enoyl-[acyl-carrier protein] reductase I
MTKLFANKKGIIMGVANERSIAWGIAKALGEQGADIGFTYQGATLEKRVRPLAASIGSDFLIPCDVTSQASMDETFAIIKDVFEDIDFIVHAIGYAPKAALHDAFTAISADDFATTMNISCFSFINMCQRAKELMPNGGSILTLTYYGAEKVFPNYNIMGVAKAALEASVRYAANDLGAANIRVNGISAGPIKTLAASGIGDLNYILGWNELNAPLGRNVTQDEVGQASMFLLSDLASAVTGEIMYVDGGYQTIGMVNPKKARQSGKLLETFPAE